MPDEIKDFFIFFVLEMMKKPTIHFLSSVKSVLSENDSFTVISTRVCQSRQKHQTAYLRCTRLWRRENSSRFTKKARAINLLLCRRVQDYPKGTRHSRRHVNDAHINVLSTYSRTRYTPNTRLKKEKKKTRVCSRANALTT